MSSFLLKKKTTKTFEQKISKLSRKTQESVNSAKKSFEKFCVENYDGRNSEAIFEELNALKGKDQTEATRQVLQDWIDSQYEKGKLTTGIQQYVSKIKKLFSHYGIRVHTEDFDEPLEYKPRIKEELHELTLDEIQEIFKHASPKKYGFYLALISTGCRPAELLQVRKKDIDTTKKRVSIRIEAENVKTRAGRSVFLTKEASGYLISRLKKLDDNDLVWAKNKYFSYAEKNESAQFAKACDNAGYTERYKSNNFRKITLYSFRSYFFGRSADVHREGYAHRMTGHGGYLPQYDRMSNEKKLEWFLKVEPELTVFENNRNKIEIQEKEKELKQFKNEQTKEIQKLREERLQDKREMLKMLSDMIRNPEKLKEFQKNMS